MKNIFFVVAIMAIAVSCNNSGNSEKTKAADSHAGHNHGGGSCEQIVPAEVKDPHAGHNHAANDGHNHASEAPIEVEGAHADEIIFPAAQAALTDFAVEQVVLSDFNQVIRSSGEVLSAQGDQQVIVAPVSGVVTFAGGALTDGAAVGAGARLFYIESKNIASGDLAAKSRAAYTKAKADMDRAEKLLADRIVSQKEFDALKFEFERARAEYEPLKNAQTSSGSAVKSPIGGYITSLNVASGDFVEMGAPLATVARNRRMQLRADVSQKYLDRLSNVSSAVFVSPSSDKKYDLREMGGRIVSVGKSSTSSGGMIPVVFEFNNPGGVVSGTFVEMYLLGSAVRDVVVVPVTAITEQQGVYYVYVQLDEQGYSRREVTLGESDGIRVRVLSGLKPGEKVVTRGAINVKMAAASGAIPHGHQH